MGANHNIGKSIDKKLKGLKDTPDEELWGRITTSLDKKKKRRIPIWWLLSGIGLLLLLFTLGFNLINTFSEKKTDQVTYEEECLEESFSTSSSNRVDDNNHTNTDYVLTKNDTTKTDSTIVQDHKKTTTVTKNTEVVSTSNSKDYKTPNASDTHAVTPANYVGSNKIADSVKLLQVSVTARNYKTFSRSLPLIGNSNDEESSKMLPLTTIDKEKTVILSTDKVVTDTEIKTSNQLVVTPQQRYRDSLMKLREKRKEDLIALRKTRAAKIKKQQSIQDSIKSSNAESPWSITVMGIGSLYKNLNNGSALGAIYNDLDVTSKLTFNYGASLNFNANDYLQLRIGVNHLRFNQSTNSVPEDAAALSSLRTVLYGSVTDVEISNFLSESNQQELNIDQSFNYVEIPFEFRIRLNDDKLQVSTIVGWSYMFSVDNSFTLRNDTGEFNLGRHALLNDSNFNVNAGIGLRTNLYKQFYLNSDVIFKYQLRPYSELPDHNPAFLNMQLGVEYRF